LESAVLDAIRRRLAGAADAPFAIGSDYRGKQDFWNVLFGTNATSNDSDAPRSLTRDLPVTIDKAWTAGLHVITQSKLIVAADRSAEAIEFLTAHTSQIGTKYAVHRVIVRFSSTDFGTQMTILIPHAQETDEESENDMKLCSDQIGTELFIKDRLKWLTEKKGME
jgi:hypothetical protein